MTVVIKNMIMKKPHRKSQHIITDAEYLEIKKEIAAIFKKLTEYEKYVGCYVKRFYTPFLKENIFKILEYRISKYGIPEFLYYNAFYFLENEQYWADIEDSVIITNELPIIKDERVANVNSPDYNGYNPYES